MEPLLEVTADLLEFCLAHKRPRSRPCRSRARAEQRHRTSTSVVVWFLAGFPLGIVAVTAIPKLCLHLDLLGWLTFVGTPVLLGPAMHLLGKWRQQEGRKPTPHLTLEGGVALGLSFSLARLAMGAIPR
jgi:hypothetical protein